VPPSAGWWRVSTHVDASCTPDAISKAAFFLHNLFMAKMLLRQRDQTPTVH
jgi:hypothetical protein